MIFYVYIIYNIKHDKFYIGQTNSLKRRIGQHNLGMSNYTSKYNGGWQLVYKKEFSDGIEAIVHERFLKKQKNKNFYKKFCKENFTVG